MAKPKKQIHNVEFKDYQRNVSIYTGEKEPTTNVLIDSYFKPKDIQAFPKDTPKELSTATATDYKEELEGLKARILYWLKWKRLTSLILTVACYITVGVHLLVIILFPLWIGVSGGYLLWVVIELFTGAIMLSFSSNDSKLKVPKQISKFKKRAAFYILMCSLMLSLVIALLAHNGLQQMFSQIHSLDLSGPSINMASIYGLMEFILMLNSTLRMVLMSALIFLLFHLHSMSQKYNITEMVEFTKRHLEQV